MEKSALADHSFIKGMGLTDSDIAALADISESVPVEPEAIIFLENDPADAFYLTVAGRVKIATVITQKLEKVLYTVPADSVFGEMGVLDKGERSASAKSIESGEIVKINREKFLELVNGDPELGRKLVRGLYGVVVNRLRLMDTAYAQNIRWGLEVSGATKLDFSELITGDVPVEISLAGGGQLTGRIVKVVETPHDLEFTISAEDKLHIVPYRSVSVITLGSNDMLLEGLEG